MYCARFLVIFLWLSFSSQDLCIRIFCCVHLPQALPKRDESTVLQLPQEWKSQNSRAFLEGLAFPICTSMKQKEMKTVLSVLTGSEAEFSGLQLAEEDSQSLFLRNRQKEPREIFFGLH